MIFGIIFIGILLHVRMSFSLRAKVLEVFGKIFLKKYEFYLWIPILNYIFVVIKAIILADQVREHLNKKKQNKT